MPHHVVALGDLVADLIVPLGELPVRPLAHQIARDIALEAGSTGSVLVLASRLGLSAQALGVVGDDFFGERVRAVLAGAGVDVSAMLAPAGSRTTTSIVLIDDAAQHVFVWMRGTGNPQPLGPAGRAAVVRADAIFTTGYALQPPATFTPAAVVEAVDLAHTRGTPVFFDLGPVVQHIDPATLEEVVGRTTVFLATAEELAAWLGEPDPQRAAALVLERGPQLVVVKLGPSGCLIVGAKQAELVSGFAVSVRNTAGAGDSFSAACIYGHLRGLPARQLGLLCNAVGALAVTKLGTGTRLPEREEIVRFLAEHRVAISV
jgi:sugar/nucleoside kinase (ribokinase family)